MNRALKVLELPAFPWGDIDALVPYASNAARVTTSIVGSQLVTVSGASHTGFSAPAVPLRWLSNPDWIGCMAVKDNVDAAQQFLSEVIGKELAEVSYQAATL